MNGHQRIWAALNGEPADTVPIMLHNFMMAAREAGVTMRQFRSNPQILARCFIEAVEKYEYDGIMVDVDTATLAGAAGVPIDFPEDQPARCHGVGLSSLQEVDRLQPVNLRNEPRVQVWLEATRLLKEYFKDEIFIRGNADQCPFSIASMMRSPQEWMVDLTDPDKLEKIHQLLRYCLGITNQFIQLMAETGADMVSNGDSPAGPDMVSPRMYREFALPYERKVVEYVHSLRLPYILHICGKTNLILEDMLSTGSDGLELDYKTDMSLAQKTLRGRTVFIGNIDPNSVLALGSLDLVEIKTRELLECFSGNPRFILNAGCAIPATTPPENLRQMIQTARKF